MSISGPLGLRAPLPTRTGATIESRLAALESVIQVAADGSVVIKGAASITVDASAAVYIKSGTWMQITSNAGMIFKAGSVDIQSLNPMYIRASTLSLPLGGMPVARVGDPVINNKISTGNPAVLA